MDKIKKVDSPAPPANESGKRGKIVEQGTGDFIPGEGDDGVFVKDKSSLPDNEVISISDPGKSDSAPEPEKLNEISKDAEKNQVREGFTGDQPLSVNKKAILVVLAVLVCIFSLISAVQANITARNISKDMVSRSKELSKQLERVETAANNAQLSVDGLSRKVKALEEKIAAIEKTANEAKSLAERKLSVLEEKKPVLTEKSVPEKKPVPAKKKSNNNIIPEKWK